MSCARTVVCVREGGAPEVVGFDGEAGVLVPPEDVGALACAVTDLLNRADKRRMIGIAARQRVRQIFPLERMISGYEDMFAAILDRR
jgi:glycosyltransferase involved in cell wall biosynthesis